MWEAFSARAAALSSSLWTHTQPHESGHGSCTNTSITSNRASHPSSFRHLLDKRQTKQDVHSRDHPSLSESLPVSLPSFHSLSLFPSLPRSLPSLLSSLPAPRSSSLLSLSSFLSSFPLSLLPPPSLSLPSLSFTRQAREEGQQLVREWQNRHTELDTALRYVCSVRMCDVTGRAAAKGHVHGRAAAKGL